MTPSSLPRRSRIFPGVTRIACLVVWLALVAGPAASAVTDPHLDTSDGSSCLFCHFPGFQSAAPGEETLLEPTIDAVCLTCHVKTECCTIGQKHVDPLFIGYSHPSDLDGADIRSTSRPKTLPLQNGRMTCNTCHFHRRPEGRDYKLVRLVDYTANGVEWTRLCQDCHSDV